MATNPTLLQNPSDPPRSADTGHKSRHVARLSNVPLLGRTVLASRIQQAASEKPTKVTFPNLLAFFQFWKWLGPYLRDLVHQNADYQEYRAGKTGVFAVTAPSGGGPMRIAVAADWGTGTLEADAVRQNMEADAPHYTVHLGDVYYMGETGEVEENCLGEARNGFTGVSWPRENTQGSFALMGNHEMYSGGQAYFQKFLKKLGLYDPARNVKDPQSASFFALETDHWLILGLDTGYHSGGVPLFTSIPLINRIPFLNVDARFDDKMLDWLEKTLSDPGRRLKQCLVLTHHQPFSSFEHSFDKPAKQLAELFTKVGIPAGRDFVWLYGHEHRLTVYNRQIISETLNVYPRCIGHGGMPVSLTHLSGPDPRILFYDPRSHKIDEDHPNTMVGYNGHVLLYLDQATLRIEYRDIDKNQLLFSETFTAAASGSLEYKPTLSPGSPLFPGTRPNA